MDDFSLLDKHLIPRLIIFRGLSPKQDTTALATNLISLFNIQNESAVVLDLALGNPSLTRFYTKNDASSTILSLAEKFWREGISTDELRSHLSPIYRDHTRILLLPGMERWLEHEALQGRRGWHFGRALLKQLKVMFPWGIIDLGSPYPGNETSPIQNRATFQTPSMLTFALLDAAHCIVNVFDSRERFDAWWKTRQSTEFDERHRFVVLNAKKPRYLQIPGIQAHLALSELPSYLPQIEKQITFIPDAEMLFQANATFVEDIFAYYHKMADEVNGSVEAVRELQKREKPEKVLSALERLYFEMTGQDG